MTGPLEKLKKRLGFLYAETGLMADREKISSAITGRLGTPVCLKRYYKGRGWGLKYLVLPDGATEPSHLVKAASRVIEHRVARHPLDGRYTCQTRFAREAEIISALAGLGLGPGLLLAGENFFVREFLPGCCLAELSPAGIACWLIRTLEALEEICNAGIFHSDPNAENVIIDQQSSRLGFIDSEIAVSGPVIGTVGPERRRYCHERLLSTLHSPEKKPAETNTCEKDLLAGVHEFYIKRDIPGLDPERAVALVRGEATPKERAL